MSEQMEVKVTEQSPVEKNVEVGVAAALLAKDVDKRLKQMAGRAKIKGFRPGKAPMKMIRQRYGKGARLDALDALVRKSLLEALKRDDLKGTIHVTEPSVESGTKPGEDVKFTFTAETLPEIEPKGYMGLAVDKVKPVVDDADIDAQLSQLQENHTAIVPVEDRDVVEAGDVVVMSYKALGEGEVEKIFATDQEVDLGDEGLLDGLAAGVAGAKKGEPKIADVTLPEEFALETLAGQTIQIEVNVSEIKHQEVPAIDDALAAESGEADTLDELKTKIRERLTESKTRETEAAAKRRMLDAVVEANPVDLPANYVQSQALGEARRQAQRLAQMGVNPEDLGFDLAAVAENVKDDVAKSIRESLLLRAVATREELKVADGDIDAHLAKVAKEQKQPLARLKARYAKGDAREQLRTQLLFERVVDFIWSKATITEVDALPEDEAAGEKAAEE